MTDDPCRAIPADEFLALTAQGVLPLDVRTCDLYATSHLRGAIFIGIDGKFAAWAERLLEPAQPLILIAAPEHVEPVVKVLRELGHTDVRGFLEGGFEALQLSGESFARTERVDTAQLANELAGAESPHLLDVRQPPEWQKGCIGEAPNLPLTEIASGKGEIPTDRRVILHCQGGYRSLIAASFFERAGHRDLVDVRGGYHAWATEGRPVCVPDQS